MARYFKSYISYFLFSVALLSSCQEGGEAGDLFGNWKMSGADSKYMAFSGSVTVIRYIQQNNLRSQIYGNFQHQGDSLFIQCVSIEGEPLDTLTVENDFGFKPFTNIRLKIDKLDGDNLVLSKDGQHWNFYKY